MSTEVSARRAATRDRLVEAAVTVFAEKGVVGAAVEEICEAAGFTRGAFYSNFTSKDDLCIALLEHHFAAQMAALDQAVAAIGSLEAIASIDELIDSALAVFHAAQPPGRHWTLATQELRLHAARSPEFAVVYRRFERRGTERVGATILAVLDALGHEMRASSAEAMGMLHAVYNHSTLGALIGSGEGRPGSQERLLADVLRALIRPKS